MNILVTQINNLGDAVAFLPTLKGLVDFFPEARISVVCTPMGEKVFSGISARVNFYPVDKKKVCSLKRVSVVPALLKTAQSLKHEYFAFSLHSFEGPSFAYLVAALLRIPRRIGYDSHMSKAQGFLTEKIPFEISRNVVEINYDLIRQVTGNWHSFPARVPIPYTSQDFARVLARLSQAGLGEGAPFVAIHPGARFKYQQWGLNNYSELFDQLKRSMDLPILFLGENNYQINAPVINGLSIKELACLLEKAAIFIGNNSGPMHIAAAVGTPCVIIQGPSAVNWEIFWQDIPHRIIKANLHCRPCEKFDSKGECLHKENIYACMRGISVELVKNVVLDLKRDLGEGALFMPGRNSPGTAGPSGPRNFFKSASRDPMSG